MSVPPPEPLIIPNGGLCSVRWDINGQEAFNVLGLSILPAGQVNQVTADAVATAVRNAFTAASGATFQHQNAHMTGVAIRDLRIAHQPDIAGAITATSGIDVSEPLPGGTSCVVTLRTNLAGKSFRGRVFVPLNGGSGWDGAAQAYSTPAVQAAQGWLTNVMTNLAASAPLSGAFSLAVVSRQLKVSTPVTLATVRSPIQGTQRRRIPHRG